MKQRIRLVVNKEEYEIEVEPYLTLAECMRDRLGLIGVRVSCNNGDCGACTVLSDGEPILSCMTLAVEADGKYTDLFARSLYLHSQGNDILIISCDLLFLPKDTMDYLRREISKKTGIKHRPDLRSLNLGDATKPEFYESGENAKYE